MSGRSALPVFFCFARSTVGIEQSKASEANLPELAFVRHGKYAN